MSHKEQTESLRQLYRIADALERQGFELPGESGFRFHEFNWSARELRLAASTLQRISESECNGIERYDHKARMRLASWTDADQANADKRRAKQEIRAMEALKSIFGPELMRDAIRVHFQGDPRGAMIVLDLRHNDSRWSERFGAW
jgi:hypothetical protein